MRFLVIGGGQIARQLVADIEARGDEAVVLRRRAEPVGSARVIAGDAGEPATVLAAAEGASAILHCVHAAYSPEAWRRELPGPERASMDAAASLGIPVVFPESVYAFGHGARRLAEDTPIAPASPLGEVRAALLADPAFAGGAYDAPPVAGLRAFGRVYAGWAYSREFFADGTYRQLGYESVEAVLEDWAQDHAARDANDLLAMMDTWQSGDVGRGRDGHQHALASITARTIVMPSTTDLYFTVADSAVEARLVPGAELRPIVSDLGHVAGRPGVRAAETEAVAAAVRDRLGGAWDR